MDRPWMWSINFVGNGIGTFDLELFENLTSSYI